MFYFSCRLQREAGDAKDLCSLSQVGSEAPTLQSMRVGVASVFLLGGLDNMYSPQGDVMAFGKLNMFGDRRYG